MTLSMNISGSSALGMNEYYIYKNELSIRPSFTYKDISSCSAIVFKCESGYAGFHYPAGSLISETDGYKYAVDMGIWIKTIENIIGKILEVRCFTPPPLEMTNSLREMEREKDVEAIWNLFMISGIDGGKIKEAKTIEEVSHEINW